MIKVKCPGLAADSFLALRPTENMQLYRLLVECISVIQLNAYVAYRIQGAPPNAVPLTE